MISWRSYTTSKVLPTFVGEKWSSSSKSESFSAEAGLNYMGLFYGDRSESASYKESKNATQTLASSFHTGTVGRYKRGSDASGNQYYGNNLTHWQRTGEEQFGLGGLESTTSVVRGSTIISRPFYTFGESGELGVSTFKETKTSPLQSVTQETTSEENYERQIRVSATMSADENGEPLVGEVWTTYATELTDAAGKTKNVTSVDLTTVKTTETVIDYTNIQSKRTVLTVGESATFETFTHPEGDVIVVANTIWQAVPYENKFPISVNSPLSKLAITGLSYAPSKFTVSFSEIYTATLPVRNESESTIQVTTLETKKTGHETTTVGVTNETYKGWFYSYEYRSCQTRSGSVSRLAAKSFSAGRNSTFEKPTQINTTTTTFKTYNGRGTKKEYDAYTTKIVDDTDTPMQDRTESFFLGNTVTENASTFRISGDLLTTKSIQFPGLLNKSVFPWSSTGDGYRRYFSTVNNETSLVSTTNQGVTFGHTWDFIFQSKTKGTWPPLDEDRGGGGASKAETSWQNKNNGAFYLKNAGGVTSNVGVGISAIKFAAGLEGLASPELTYQTENTHSTVGIFMTANAQHTWGGGQNAFGYFTGIASGNISQNIVGAVPLYPTFSGLIRHDTEGWELCDSSEYTTVRGSRVGSNLSTTIAWQTVEGSLTKNKTSSGTFTVNSTISADFGVQIAGETIRGGFETPHASRTVFMPPGVLLTTTFDSEGFGSGSSLLATGSTFKTQKEGNAPITIFSYISEIQGYGVKLLSLIDDGMP
jgi:hypothetical protein